jgi:outer membrane protein assembly factor BamB
MERSIVNHRLCYPSAICLVAVCLLPSVFWGSNFEDGLVPERNLSLPDDHTPSYTVGGHTYRSFVVSYDLPSKTGDPVIGIAMKRKVWYIDGGTLEVVKKREFAENEYVTISQNGKFISVFSKFRNRRTGKTLWKTRIEDYTGKRLWEFDHKPFGSSEPTPSGGFIDYTTGHPKEYFSGMAGSSPHSLLIYDNKGNLLLEGVDYDESRGSKNIGVISADGDYLAFVFRWIPPENREDRAILYLDEADKACLVLYDIAKGTEEWRHYFSGSEPTHLSIGPFAERIVCSVSTAAIDALQSADYHVYSFDRNGNMLFERPIRCASRTAPPGELRMSPDGRFCAVSTQDNDIFVIRTDDGTELWHWEAPSDVLGIGSLVVDDTGRVIAFGAVGSRESGLYQPRIFLFDSGGALGSVLRIEDMTLAEGAELRISRDGSTLWLRSGNSLSLFSVPQRRSLNGHN